MKVLQSLKRAAASTVMAAMVATMGSVALTPTASASSTEVTATTAVNIRAGASVNSARLGVLYRGQKVTAISASNGWTTVRRNGRTAYIASAYLRGSRPAAAVAAKNSRTGGSLDRGGSSGLDRTNANIQKVARHVWATQPAITTMYGVRGGSGDHPAGRAVDVMIPNYGANKALGWNIANYYRAHASEFGIRYIIFDQQIWNIARDREGWRRMAGRGGDTANHKDHVHINT